MTRVVTVLMLLGIVLLMCQPEERTDPEYRSCMVYEQQSLGRSLEDARDTCKDFPRG